ncbi:MAG: tetratricopeptide repeat protein [Thermodesulfobacteriota bacterium]|nr:tetratricopeptide repeat protein [Thermodesulfobacteriota bacterium]
MVHFYATRDTQLSSYEKYKLAILFLNADQEAEGIRLLKCLKAERSLNGRKSLFVLGRVAAAKRDWNSAINYYNEYIDKYADQNSFFTLKAYSRLIDAYWARGDSRKTVRHHAEQLADIVNNISDFKTQFIMANDLRRKGLPDLASATFNIALAAAKDRIAKDKDDYEKIETRFLVARYACRMKKFDLVSDYADHALDSIKNLNFQHYSNERIERINYINAQTHLWLAQAANAQQDYFRAIAWLKTFLSRFPNSSDAGYARCMMGRAYRKIGRTSDAVNILQRIQTDDVWGKKARKILKEVASDSQ